MFFNHKYQGILLLFLKTLIEWNMDFILTLPVPIREEEKKLS